MIRTKVTGRTVVNAGTVEELAALALAYASGEHGPLKPFDADACHFENAAKHLLDRSVAEGAGRVEFWSDKPDGTPYMGPWDLRPKPDEGWLAAHPEYRAEPPVAQGR